MNLRDLTTKKFNSYKDFEIFEEKLKALISVHKLIEIGISNYKNYHFYQYKVPEKNEIFCLSIPENAWRGFFLYQEDMRNHVDYLIQTDKKKAKGCIFFLVIIFIIILTRILFKKFL